MAPGDETFPLGREPLPDAGGSITSGAADRLTEEERKRRRRKIAALAGILVVLAIIIYMIIRALSGSSPLPSIPSELPHYVSDIYGTDQPMGVAVSPSGGRIYVTESEGPRLVRIYDSSGHQLGTLKPPGHNQAWHLPVYVAVSPRTEDVYVSDRLRQDVDVYSPTGKYLGALRPTGHLGKGAQPLGLAFGSEGDLYMTDVGGPGRITVSSSSAPAAKNSCARSDPPVRSGSPTDSRSTARATCTSPTATTAGWRSSTRPASPPSRSNAGSEKGTSACRAEWRSTATASSSSTRPPRSSRSTASPAR